MSGNVKKAASHGRSTNKTRTDEVEAAVLDRAAIMLQRLRSQGRLADDQPLIRLDYRHQAQGAPFRFDSTRGILHRRDCGAIPADARSAIYAVWQVTDDDRSHTCRKCRPAPAADGRQRLTTTDLVFGLLSIVDQFGTILFERGKEFRQSSRGRELEQSLSGMFEDLDKANRQGLDFISATLDEIVRSINEYNDHDGQRNGKSKVGRKNGRSVPVGRSGGIRS
jgi:hypothetical protein